MKVDKIITQIRKRCAIFSNRVGGASELPVIAETTVLAVPYAFVVPVSEDGGDMQAGNGYQQEITQSFSVLVFVTNEQNERGHLGVNSLETIRAQLFKALLGWQIEPEYEAIWFNSGEQYARNRAMLGWEYQFKYSETIAKEDTYLQVQYDELPDMKLVNVRMDAIDPMADPKHPVTGKKPGPDGRIEHRIDIKTGA